MPLPEIKHKQVGKWVVISLPKRTDAISSPRLRQIIGQLLENGWPNLIFNLNAVTMLDSTALAVLIWAKAESAKREGVIRLAGLSQEVKVTLRITQLENQFETYPTAAKAATD